ncbi:MAG: hypothetical protein LBU87_01355 [Lactobacillales bacterium]|jgi:hypothetical protein|nr:hypothetical protein [Lactobacillales bacterium]
MAQTPVQDQASTLLTSFKDKKEAKRTAVMQEAQLLVNLYRHLGLFGADFTIEYNKMLLNASTETHMILTDFLGGQIVRQYLEFLQSSDPLKTNVSKSADEIVQEGYLPDPEADIAPRASAGGDSEKMAVLPQVTGAHSLKNLVQELISINQKESMKQATFLQSALNQMQEGFSKQISVLQTGGKTGSSGGIDLEKFQETQQKMMDQTLEKIIQAQTDVLTRAFTHILESSQNLATTQTDKLINYMKKKQEDGDNYRAGSPSKPKIPGFSKKPFKSSYPSSREIEIVSEPSSEGLEGMKNE